MRPSRDHKAFDGGAKRIHRNFFEGLSREPGCGDNTEDAIDGGELSYLLVSQAFPRDGGFRRSDPREPLNRAGITLPLATILRCLYNYQIVEIFK